MNVEITKKFEAVKSRVTHSRPISEPITTHLNPNSRLRQLSKLLRGNQSQAASTQILIMFA